MNVLDEANKLVHGGGMNRPVKKCRKCGYVGDRFAPSRPRANCLTCLAQEQREYRLKRPKGYWQTKDKKYALMKRYGLTIERFEEMAEAQGWKCAICKVDPRVVPLSQRGLLHVDHDHKKGNVRALLCNGCNRAIGLINERPDVARALAAYLDIHK